MDRKELLRRLARAVLAFQDSYLAREDSPIGLLCQVSSKGIALLVLVCLSNI